MHLSVAQPSTAGLRSAYSEGNLNDNSMYGDGGLNGPSHYGSVPWLNENSGTKHLAATNKYLHTTSSIFDDPRSRDKMRQDRGRQALEELRQQVADKEDAKRREREEEDRIFAAMNAPTTYNPSFHEDAAPRRRTQGYAAPAPDPAPAPIDVGNLDSAAEVQDAGGYYGGDGGFDYGPSSYQAPQYEQPQAYAAPRFYGGRRPQRYNANMTSEERALVNQDRASQNESELQWQIQMKRQLDAERKKKEELEERLLEESIKKQQERMKQEYEAEVEKKRRKEEEQTRRREAQLRHMELIQNQAANEKKNRVARARAAAEDAASSTPTESLRDERQIKPTKTPAPEINEPPPPAPPKQEPRRRVPKKDDDFGLNLKSDSRFLAAQQPNKFFDSPTTPVKMARTAEDRKRPKPMPEAPYTVSRHTRPPGTHGPPKENYRSYPGGSPPNSKVRSSRPKTTLGPAPPSPVKAPQPSLPPVIKEPQLPPLLESDREPIDNGTQTKEVKNPSPPPSAHMEAQTDKVQMAHTEMQTTMALDQWEAERNHDEPRPQIVKGKPFDWSVKIEGLTDDDKQKLGQSSEEELKEFKERNGGVLGQLQALKTGLRSSAGDQGGWNPGGVGPSSYQPSSASGAPTRNDRNGTDLSATIPAGKLEDVDYLRITTADKYSLPGTAAPVSKQKPRDPPFNPEDTSGTTLRKFLERADDP